MRGVATGQDFLEKVAAGHYATKLAMAVAMANWWKAEALMLRDELDEAAAEVERLTELLVAELRKDIFGA
jgi:hypothetical protein